MEGFTLDDLRAAVELSSVCMGIFDDTTGRVHSPNGALREIVRLDEFLVKVLAQSDERIFGHIEIDEVGSLPVSLRVLSGHSPACLVEVYLAHGKQCSTRSRSDVIQLVEMTSDGVWEWFPSLQYEYMSERFWDILGYDHKLMPNSPDAWTRIIDQGDLVRAVGCFDKHVATKGALPYNLNVSYTHKNGRVVQVKCRGAVVEWLPDGTPWRMLGTHTNITEITEAVDAKARFVSRMSHEIRTPICAILHECELLEQHRGAAVIADSCGQLLSLCNDILTVEKLCLPTAIEVTRTSISAEEFLHRAVRRHVGQAKKKGISLTGAVDRAPPGDVMADVSKCNQVVDNLISNAIKYTKPSGKVSVELCCRVRAGTHSFYGDGGGSQEACETGYGGTVSCDGETKVMGVAQDDAWQVEFVVKDTGFGIYPEDREVVFDRFRQANSSMQGAGLGLSISKELALLMSGDVVLSYSEVSRGSTFVFSFPAPLAPPCMALKTVPMTFLTGGGEVKSNSVSGSASRGDDRGKTTTATIRILSADDMLTNRKIMRKRMEGIEKQLEAGAVEVVDAINGLDAVRVFRDGGEFHMVFMDCLMPEMDGFQAARAIHKVCDERGIARVPVVAVTASVSTGLQQECREAGMTHVVTKPFNKVDLLAVFTAAVEAEAKSRGVTVASVPAHSLAQQQPIAESKG